MTNIDPYEFADSLSEETINKIEEYANKLLTIKDIAVLIGISSQMMSLMVADEDNRVSIAYNRGKANRLLVIHEKEIDLAEAGSAQAMANLHGFVQQMNSAEE